MPSQAFAHQQLALTDKFKPTVTYVVEMEVTKFHLVVTFILKLLITNVRPNHFFIQPDRRYKVPSCPKHLSGEISLPTTKIPRYRNRTLPFDITHSI